MKKISLGLILLITTFLGAQNTSKHFVKQAEKELYRHYPDYEVALAHLREAKKLDSNEVDIDYLMALTHLQTPHYQKALPIIDYVIENKRGFNKELYFLKAHLHHLNADFDTANVYYNEYLESLTEDEKLAKPILSVTFFILTHNRQGHTFDEINYENIGRDVINRMRQCVIGKELMSNPVYVCLLYTSPSPRDGATSRMPSSA